MAASSIPSSVIHAIRRCPLSALSPHSCLHHHYDTAVSYSTVSWFSQYQHQQSSNSWNRRASNSSTSASSSSSSSSQHAKKRTNPNSDDDDDNAVVAAFDRQVKLLQRNGAARAHRYWTDGEQQETTTFPAATKEDLQEDHHDEDYYDYFRQEIATRLVDRLDDIKRGEGFPLALDIGAGAGYIYQALCAAPSWDGIGAIGGVRKLVQLDSSRDMIFRDHPQDASSSPSSNEKEEEICSTYRLVANEEGTLPFPSGTFDLVTSAVALHWVNDLPLLFSEIRRVLKPDGCFLLAMMGGSTLPELRASMVLAELERDGGVSPHIGPFCQLSDVGSLMQAAGFALPTIDIDTIHLGYPHAMVVMEHLQRMGEANASLKRKPRTSRDTFLAAACIYDHLFSAPEVAAQEEAAMVEATVQVIYAIGWSPHASQPKPKARGSATHKVGSLEVTHHPSSSSSS